MNNQIKYEQIPYSLLNNKKGEFPKIPSSYELKSAFADLENYNMVSDTIVWHPVKYKLLFGSEADNTYKANFRVIKNVFRHTQHRAKTAQILP